MNSRDILTGFFADAAFSEVCTREKFRRECASSLNPEIASKIYDVVSEQHGKTVESVSENVMGGRYLPDTKALEKWGENAQNRMLQQDSTSISGLIEGLGDAVQSSETQAAILQQQVDEQLLEAQKRKNELAKLIENFNSPDSNVVADTKRSAEKCISLLRAGKE